MFTWIGRNHPEFPVFVTIPHSGELIPDEAHWLKSVSAQRLLTDVDRFVDRLYAPAVESLSLPALFAAVHRYAADLNRFPSDVDRDSVEGAEAPSGQFSKGFHWVRTTRDEPLMAFPISRALHDAIVVRYHDAFHREVEAKVAELQRAFPERTIYHLDCHSMPSEGTAAHADRGQRRPDAVISDFEGKSASVGFRDAVVRAYEGEGFRVSVNWPYKGGRITQRYGRPVEGHETIQIELNRALYMDESTREKLPQFDAVSARLQRALARVLESLGGL